MFFIKLALQRYVKENLQDLLRLDLSVARLLGAPAPHTLSSYAYKLFQEGKLWGKVTKPTIDLLFSWLMDQKEHCKADYERVIGK